jgi:hypothetical protein
MAVILSIAHRFAFIQTILPENRRRSNSLAIVNPQTFKGGITSDILVIAIAALLTTLGMLLVVGDDRKKLLRVEKIGIKNVIITV